MKTIYLICLALLLTNVFCFAQISLTNLTCENSTNPIGIDIKYPGLSWQLVSGQRNTMQTAYELQVSDDVAFKGHSLVWKPARSTQTHRCMCTTKVLLSYPPTILLACSGLGQ